MLIRWLSCPARSLRLTLEGAEGGLPVVEPVIEPLYAVQSGVRLEGLPYFEYAVHAGGIPGAAKLVEGLDRVVAGGFGVVLGGFDGGQVADPSELVGRRPVGPDGQDGA